MLMRLIARLKVVTVEPLPAEDARLAIAALLARAARVDGAYVEGEADTIERVLARRYRLSAEEARQLRLDGEEADTATAHLYKLAELVRFAVPVDDRVAVLQGLWEVVLADGLRHPSECQLVRRCTQLLGLSEHDALIAERNADA